MNAAMNAAVNAAMNAALRALANEILLTFCGLGLLSGLARFRARA
jgi:hypothetical protein